MQEKITPKKPDYEHEFERGATHNFGLFDQEGDPSNMQAGGRYDEAVGPDITGVYRKGVIGSKKSNIRIDLDNNEATDLLREYGFDEFGNPIDKKGK